MNWCSESFARLSAALLTCSYHSGGGQNGLMGLIASSALAKGGRVHGVIPTAVSDPRYISTTSTLLLYHFSTSNSPRRTGLTILRREQFLPPNYAERVMAQGERETPVKSMHERKTLMSRESAGFVVLPVGRLSCPTPSFSLTSILSLPLHALRPPLIISPLPHQGGYGTLEELAETTTWTQLSIHCKPVIVLNVCGFYDGLKTFREKAISSGFIAEANRPFMTFVDEDNDDPSFDWGEAALQAMEKWEKDVAGGGKAYPLTWPEEDMEKLT